MYVYIYNYIYIVSPVVGLGMNSSNPTWPWHRWSKPTPQCSEGSSPCYSAGTRRVVGHLPRRSVPEKNVGNVTSPNKMRLIKVDYTGWLIGIPRSLIIIIPIFYWVKQNYNHEPTRVLNTAQMRIPPPGIKHGWQIPLLISHWNFHLWRHFPAKPCLRVNKPVGISPRSRLDIRLFVSSWQVPRTVFEESETVSSAPLLRSVCALSGILYRYIYIYIYV